MYDEEHNRDSTPLCVCHGQTILIPVPRHMASQIRGGFAQSCSHGGTRPRIQEDALVE